ncbi:MAG: DNA repair protein RadA [Alphaproteobacteria bacterium]|jgi:DNA repair protein RadA/Sms|nr:DNA repair protein RadA [Alphaproteobacteria bacterium]MDP7223113.1 DNA repair protein RadA [Alphaproteobacteria bacterium]
MAKTSKSYICQSCGTPHRKWGGKCDGCGEWNSLVEEITEAAVPKGMSGSRKGRSLSFSSLKSEETEKRPRLVSTLGEFDRVCGGGLVPGSAMLIGGDPGIGKSTLLLQVVCALSKKNVRCAYVSGEEAIDQVRLRADRLELADSPIRLAAATNVRDIVSSMEDRDNPIDLIVIDSIQTMYVDNVDSAPGTVTQVRTSSNEIIRCAKKNGICVLFVGHVTKDGQIAGPRVLEHMVDTVLYFEGDRSHQFRILRSVKNRFGATDEIGVFEMATHGLAEVANPSEIFLAQRQQDVAGSAVFAGLEGSRPVLVEIQALVAPTSLATPRRAVIGWDNNRLAMVLAVLEARCGLQFSGRDIFLNVAGGIRINEPAADMAVAAALISSMTNVATPKDAVFFGEIGLGGEIRPVAQPDLRLKEASKLGFSYAFMPVLKKKKGQAAKASSTHGIAVDEVNNTIDLVGLLSHETNVSKYAS